MSKKQVVKALMYANGLANDIAGNVLSGNDIRAAAYITALHEVLKEGAAIVEAGSDFRAEQRFDQRLNEINDKLEENLAKSPFDKDKMDANFARFEEAGYTLRGVKGDSGLSPEDLGISPEQLEEMLKQRS